MTDPTRALFSAVIEQRDACCRRARYYHTVLRHVLAYLREYQPELGIICSECGRADGHEDTCIGYEIERALAADDAAIARLAAVEPGDSDNG